MVFCYYSRDVHKSDYGDAVEDIDHPDDGHVCSRSGCDSEND